MTTILNMVFSMLFGVFAGDIILAHFSCKSFHSHNVDSRVFALTHKFLSRKAVNMSTFKIQLENYIIYT